jgi:hypothetical protein
MPATMGTVRRGKPGGIAFLTGALAPDASTHASANVTVIKTAILDSSKTTASLNDKTRYLVDAQA